MKCYYIKGLGLFFLICLSYSLSATPAVSKIEAEVFKALSADSSATDSTEVLVYLGEKADLSSSYLVVDRTARIQFVYHQLVETAQRSQQQVIAKLEKNQLQYKSYYIENRVLVMNPTRTDLLEIAALPQVESIRRNVSAKLELPDISELGHEIKPEDTSIPSHLRKINVDKVWDMGIKGKGIVIAGQDTGYYWQHSALKKQYRGNTSAGVDHNYNWHDAVHRNFSERSSCSYSSAEPCDDRSHGTHTMGTMVGDDGGSNRIGVAPEAQWIGCRNMNNGVGTVATYLECFEFLLAPYPNGGDPQKDGRPDLAPHIINNSWACPPKEGCKGDEFINAVRAHKAAGIAVVVSAGNSGSRCETVNAPPGSYADELISVAAWNMFLNEVVYFSSRGPSNHGSGLVPNITAPGAPIRSSVTGGVNSYDDKMGTSMASPHIAGVIALMWSAHPELIGDIDRTTAILFETAGPIRVNQSCGGFSGSKVPNVVGGHGLVDAYKAVTAL